MIRWQRHPRALWRRSSDRVLVLPEGRGNVLLLEGVGAVVWALLEEPVTVADLTEVLLPPSDPPKASEDSQRFVASTDAAEVADELAGFLHELAAASAVCEVER